MSHTYPFDAFEFNDKYFSGKLDVGLKSRSTPDYIGAATEDCEQGQAAEFSLEGWEVTEVSDDHGNDCQTDKDEDQEACEAAFDKMNDRGEFSEEECSDE